ncbi:MAG: hypothetical protein M1825_003459 [Sarcosagium campestre]|nr:MAG: hypothetical protein M1825_003459 [Sarcosagium campestre]
MDRRQRSLSRDADDNTNTNRHSILQTPIEWSGPPVFPRTAQRIPSEPNIPQSPVSPVSPHPVQRQWSATQEVTSPPLSPSMNTQSGYPDEKSAPVDVHPAHSAHFAPVTQDTSPRRTSVVPNGGIQSPRLVPQHQHQHQHEYQQHRQYQQDQQYQQQREQTSPPAAIPPTSPPTTTGNPDAKSSPHHLGRSAFLTSPTFPPSPFQSPTGAPLTSRRDTYNPHSATGPNGLSPESHKPGQATHPNMRLDASPSWQHSLCDCSDPGVCCLGLALPCMLYGRTQYRLAQKSGKKDPTDLLAYKACNGACGLFCLANCGFSCNLKPFLPLRVLVLI